MAGDPEHAVAPATRTVTTSGASDTSRGCGRVTEALKALPK
jgi:hypothetical protein